MSELAGLFIAFARIGVLTFGGGYAMLPMIQREIVENRKWATEEEVVNYFAIGQCTPGIIAVNTATFIGFKRKGIPGAIAATLGVIFPSLVIISVIAAFIQGYSDIPAVKHAFAGITAAVAVLIINAVIKLWKAGVKGMSGVAIFAASFAAAVIANVPTMIIVIVTVAGGILWKLTEKFRTGGPG